MHDFASASHPRHQPEPPTEPSNHSSMFTLSSFSNIRIDLLSYILVTLDVTHFEMSRLKAVASGSTVAKKKKAAFIHSQHKKKRQNPDIILWQDKKQASLSPLLNTNAFASHPRHHPEPPTEPPNHNSMFTSCQVILKYTYRLTSSHASDFGCVPLGNVAVEGGAFSKRVPQCRDFGNVPHTNVTVKRPHGQIRCATCSCIVSTPYYF
jgi:hypothetical protein